MKRTAVSLPTAPGTYALALQSEAERKLRIGHLGIIDLQPGIYIYIGSAFGPGGLAARLKHHQKIARRPHWHVDYLRAACDWKEVWYSTNANCHEHDWANALAGMPGATIPLPGFGASDCACASHLFYFTHFPSMFDKFFDKVRDKVRKMNIE